MDICVQKFGGTSTATSETREHIYRKIEQRLASSKRLVVVISAMGRKGDPYATETLLGLLQEEIPMLNPRESDMIYSCGEIISCCIVVSALQNRGHKAIFLTGQQAGIVTDGSYTDSQIVTVQTDKIANLLNKGYLVVVAGSQGATVDGEITSLGRGGSDTTACALGVALGADEVEIFTDVEGIMTGDPRKVKHAHLLRSITHEDCIHMADCGTQIMHPRSVRTAAQRKCMKLYVKSTFSDYAGTLIGVDEHVHATPSYLVGVASMEVADGVVVSLVGNGLDRDPEVQQRVKSALQQENIPFLSLLKTNTAVQARVAPQDLEKALLCIHRLL